MVRYPALLHSTVISYLQNENVTVLEKVKLKLYGQAVFRISNGLALLDPDPHSIGFLDPDPDRHWEYGSDTNSYEY
jgi:hypothetical protein